jgi:hypothetical protein
MSYLTPGSQVRAILADPPLTFNGGQISIIGHSFVLV